MKTKILADFQICISAPLNLKQSVTGILENNCLGLSQKGDAIVDVFLRVLGIFPHYLFYKTPLDVRNIDASVLYNGL